MKKLFTILLVLFLSHTLFAQDIDIYQKKKNTNYKLPYLNPQMSFDEFQLLNRTLRMQDMLYAMIVPGYIHFKAKDPAMGWGVLSARMAGFGGLTYVYLKNDFTFKELLNTSGKNLPNYNEFKTQQKIVEYSFGLIIATYLFDWIHGKHRLNKKQEMIRYKYGLKLNIEMGPGQSPRVNRAYPNIQLQYHL